MFQVLAISSICSGQQIYTTNDQILEKAVGETLKLDCLFTTTLADVGRLEIEWSVRLASSPSEATVVLVYSGGQIYDGYYRPLQGVYFHAVDPGKGDATIHFSLLTPTDWHLQVPGQGGSKYPKHQDSPQSTQCSIKAKVLHRRHESS